MTQSALCWLLSTMRVQRSDLTRVPRLASLQIFVMASVLPTSGDDVVVTASGATESAPREFGLISEMAKTLISLVVEVAGVQTTMQLIPNLSKFSAGTRVLAIALGMAFGDALLKYALPIFWGARQAEFSWSNIEMALASNVSLLLHLAFVAAVWLRTRTDLSKAALPVVYAVIAASAVLPSVDKSDSRQAQLQLASAVMNDETLTCVVCRSVPQLPVDRAARRLVAPVGHPRCAERRSLRAGADQPPRLHVATSGTRRGQEDTMSGQRTIY